METKTLAFEIGTEEIPAFDLKNATEQFEKLVAAMLERLAIPYQDFQVFSTPRRIAVVVSGLESMTRATSTEYKGPKTSIAFDAAGAPTPAAIGFAKGKGASAEMLEVRNVDGEDYVFVTQNIVAKNVADLLEPALLGLIKGISWPKSCKWGSQTELFSRPVRWILAMFGCDVINVEFAGVKSSNQTSGHRVLSPGMTSVGSAEKLSEVYSDIFVVPSQEKREQIIRSSVEKIQQETGLMAKLPPKTLTEVINLCEYPQPMMAMFDEEFLRVPEEIIVDAMLMHQRYFPLYAKDGVLTNKFIIVSNGDPKFAKAIVSGNERVVRARLSDAKFFYEVDLATSMDDMVSRLDKLVFQEDLGSVLLKSQRICKIVSYLATQLNLGESESEACAKAAYLCKADLVSNAVVEFTSTQGVMGSYYATARGESKEVASAIAHHYRPKAAGGDLPESMVGKVVALADKLDTLCGLFAIGQQPTGSSDPYALRRSSLGILAIMRSGVDFSLVGAIDYALGLYDNIEFDSQAVSRELVEFFVTRTRVSLKDEKIDTQIIDAVLSAGVGIFEPMEIEMRSRILSDFYNSHEEVMDNLGTAYARANNLRDDAVGTDCNLVLMGEYETNLSNAISDCNEKIALALQDNDYSKCLVLLSGLRTPIDLFFDKVMIMDSDPSLKENRLKLLNSFVEVFGPIANFEMIAKKR